jgi:hypothetical protein
MRIRNPFLLTCFWTYNCIQVFCQSGTSESSVPGTVYNPAFWIEGAVDYRKAKEISFEQCDLLTKDLKSSGWQGVLYWGASRAGSTMEYFYKSPYLETQEWADFKGDGLGPLAKAAHSNGMKVMVNMEGVNPYHWVQNQWTPENIKKVADDLASAGADAVFEECFEVKSDVFQSLARQLKSENVDYISGTDPMLLREANFATLWPETSIINIYNYYLKRDKIFNIATLAQHGSLGYGWAKYWNKPTALISPLTRNWGIPLEYSPAVVKYLCLIRALQFRVDNFIIFGGREKYDPVSTRLWINSYVEKQEKNRPLMNIVVLLEKQEDYSGSETGTEAWNRLFNSGDAITSGAMNAVYNIIVSDRVVPADAYWIYTTGGSNDRLPEEVVSLFDSDIPVFIQCGKAIPSGSEIDPGWKMALQKCGINGTVPFSYGRGSTNEDQVSLPPNQEQDLPYTGYYKGEYLRFTGTDVQRGIDLRAGTVVPKKAYLGAIDYCTPNSTYGRGPFIVGLDNKYLVAATSLNWEVAYPISDLLSGSGIKPSSNVWGIAGENITALLAIETTELEIIIPGLEDGAEIKVEIWDREMHRYAEESLIYRAPYKKILHEYDLILIEKIH